MDKLKKKGARSLGGAKKKEYFCNYLGLLPFFILFGVFMLYPFLYGVVMSFTDWSVSSGKEGSILWGCRITSLCYQEKASHLKGF